MYYQGTGKAHAGLPQNLIVPGVSQHAVPTKDGPLMPNIWAAGDLPGAAVSPRGCPDVGPVFSFAKRPQDMKAVRWPDHGFYDWPEVRRPPLIEFCLYTAPSDGLSIPSCICRCSSQKGLIYNLTAARAAGRGLPACPVAASRWLSLS